MQTVHNTSKLIDLFALEESGVDVLGVRRVANEATRTLLNVKLYIRQSIGLHNVYSTNVETTAKYLEYHTDNAIITAREGSRPLLFSTDAVFFCFSVS